jgi:nucleotidyltransferase/DNA polymerase involved in DNA repair
MQKPDGLVVLESATLPDRLFALEMTDLPGISDRREGRLNDGGIRTVEQFVACLPDMHGRSGAVCLAKECGIAFTGTTWKVPRRRKPSSVIRGCWSPISARLRREEYFATVLTCMCGTWRVLAGRQPRDSRRDRITSSF